jgi:hypothetical protein
MMNGERMNFNDPEWKKLQEERRDNAEGDHITTESGLLFASQQDFEDKIARAMLKLQQMDPPGPPNRWTRAEIFAGLSAAVIVIGAIVGVTTFGVATNSAIYTAINNDRETTNKQFTTVAASMLTMQAGIENLKSALDDERKATALRTDKYIPEIEKAVQAQELLTERVQTMAQSITSIRDWETKSNADLRQAITDLLKAQSTDHTELEVMRSKQPPAGH